MIVLALTLAHAAPHDTHAAAAPPVNATFEALKSLAGTWKGTAQHGGEPMPAEVVWRVSGSGTSVIETLFSGTPHEMITVYYPDGDGVMLTHYCASGNQPRMRLDPKSPPANLHFAFVDATNMKPADNHMHEGDLRLIDADHLQEAWTSWEGGKPAGAATFTLARAK